MGPVMIVRLAHPSLVKKENEQGKYKWSARVRECLLLHWPFKGYSISSTNESDSFGSNGLQSGRWSDMAKPIKGALHGHMYTGWKWWSVSGLTNYNGHSVVTRVVTHYICRFSSHATLSTSEVMTLSQKCHIHLSLWCHHCDITLISKGPHPVSCHTETTVWPHADVLISYRRITYE